MAHVLMKAKSIQNTGWLAPSVQKVAKNKFTWENNIKMLLR
jgi:hypothetical protein